MLHLYPSTEKRSILIKDIVAALDKAAKGVKDAGSRKEEESQVLNTSMAEDPDVDRILLFIFNFLKVLYLGYIFAYYVD